ncbi:hypothetical protein MKX01_021635 [Papaver californicum]|nr:hypothetical protein MKX01_021635 [Papaver californicum]
MELPVIDLSQYLEFSTKLLRPSDESNSSVEQELNPLTKNLYPRCSVEDNDRSLDMMEKYFDKPDDFKRHQERSHLHYQVGVTPEGVEVPRSLVDKDLQQKLSTIPEENQPSTPVGPDPKWRYMWRVGPRPSKTCFQVVAEMAAIGFGLPKDAFTSLMKQGPHLLAPTGSDLQRYGKEGTVFAGYHYDLNFLTIHGRSRFPGLNIWLRNGQKMEVKVPVGCLLIQTGKQLEWLTGGECQAGMHEVVVTNRTLDAVEAACQQNRSLWRVSSTLFAHIASDVMIEPLGHFADSPLAEKYPSMCAGEFVELELAVINLKGKTNNSDS